jgi:hypothetical protein
MLSMKKLVAGVATSALALSLTAVAAYAQETTGGINGTVTDDAGRPLANATVRVVNNQTNQTFTALSDSTGQFTLRNLPVGGPYQVTVQEPAHAGKTITIDAIPLGQAYQLTVALNAPGVTSVTVTGSRMRGQTLQTGPRSTFTATDIQTLPSFARDIRDVARLNPFVTLDPTNNNAVIVAGNNNRFNTIYVDGVKQSDDFGLNANGFPTQRSPISVDLVASTNVEIAPYDVQYGSFQGGLINIVTKSGGNQFHGTAFYEYDSNKLGAGSEFVTGFTGYRQVQLNFRDKYYGFTLGGPIIRDRLFFELGYEKYQGLPVGGTGPADATGVPNPISGITVADVTQIQGILQSVYSYNTGTYGVAQATEDTKKFAKLTWQITDKHRAVLEAQKTEGSTFNNPGSSVAGRTLGLFSNSYNFVQPLEAYTGFLYSNWTPNLSTELSYTHRKVGGLTSNNGATPFARFRVNLPSGAAVFVGPDISRQANALEYTDKLFRARGNFTYGQHTFTAGYEREQLDVFNLFVQNATGDYTFGPTIVGGVTTATVFQNLQNRIAQSLNYANAADNNANSGAANWGDILHTVYFQDQWRPIQGLTITAGLRGEFYQQDDKPQLNPFFQSNYGISNQATLDGKKVIMPRLGFNWRPDPTLTINGGFGLFSGGSPNVWISNNYSNTGNLLGSVNISCPANTPGCNPALVGVTGGSIPASVQAANTLSANRATGITNALDPDFKPPAVWKTSIGAAKTLNFAEMGWTGRVGQILGNDWRIHGDFLYQKTKDAVTWVDLLSAGNVATTAPDGRPIFNPARYIARQLTNSYDLLLTNTHKGYTRVWTVGLDKAWENGLAFSVNYTHTDAKDVNPGTSSVALSNYSQAAFADPNHLGLSISNYQIKNQIKYSLNYSRQIFGDNRTSIRLYAQRRSGLPFSYTFDSTATSGTSFDPVFGLPGAVQQRDAELLYIPAADSSGNVTATSDPRVTYAPSFNVAAFNTFLQQTGLAKYAGQISPRNAFKSRDVTTVDLQISQEIPAFFPRDAKGELYFSIFNLGNLIDPKAGVLDQYGFPYFYPAVVASLTCGAPTANGVAACPAGQTRQYRYESFGTRNPTVNTGGSPPASLWAFKLGVRYKF